MDQIYLKGHYGSNVLSRDINLSKTFQGVTKKLLAQLYRLIEDTWENNTALMLLYPDLNLLKMFANTTQTSFDKHWLNWSKWTMRVNSYCSWLLIVKCFQLTICFKSYCILIWTLKRFFQTICTSNHICFCML